MSEFPKSFDAVIVGGGMIGCSIAAALCERGRTVALLEAASIGSGTSGNSFAWINGTSKTSSEAYHRLNASGLHAYLELARRFGEKRIGLHTGGTLEWGSPADEAALANLREKVSKLETWSYPVSWVSATDLCALEPHVAFPEGAEGLYAIADPWLDVPVHLEFLVSRLTEMGARVLENTSAEELIADDDGKVLGVRTTGGTLNTKHLVLATGPSTSDVLSQLTGYEGFAARFPMVRAPGLLVTTPPHEHREWVRHILYDSVNNVHIRPSASGGLLLGSDETDGLVEEDSDHETVLAAARRLLEKAQAVLPAFDGPALADYCDFRIGIRAVPADGDSIIGPLPSADGLFVVCTHSGITMAPSIGAMSAEAIINQTIPDVLKPFGLERFQL